MEIAAGVAVALVVLALIGISVFGSKPRVVEFAKDADIKQEVDRYRAAIQSKTLCEHCLTPNPARSNYCQECGKGL